jgi:ATP adenylyltransferase
MNRFPYNNGHLMIVPFQHTCDMKALSNDEKIELIDLLQSSQDVLKEVMRPQGFNIGMNIGRLAGAGIDCHLHFHLVPRWGGDTNFMPIVGHTKVISEGLEETWEKLHSVFKKR